MLTRPHPPADMLDPLAFGMFAAGEELMRWTHETFINPDGRLANADHLHLEQARIGMLWTNEPNGRHGKAIVGQAEPGTPMAMGKWAKARLTSQLVGWFGTVPDFVITLYADYAAGCGDAEFCALVEHELYHCGQERDAFGAPKFRKATGKPAFAMRGHDVEEFVGVVRRYGVGAGAGETLALVEAAQRAPEIAAASIAMSCGTCQHA